MLKIYQKEGSKKNYIVTLPIGKSYFSSWVRYALPSWKGYCKKNNLGLISITHDMINKKNHYYKKRSWQKMLLGTHIC